MSKQSRCWKMDFEKLEVLRLHRHPKLLKACCDMINEEWPRSETARMMSLQSSSDALPTSLILVQDQLQVLGHCKLTPIPSIPESCFIETVVISKSMRGKNLGSYLMHEVEKYCKEILKLKMLHLSTKGQEIFYTKLGYKQCPPISIYGVQTNNLEATSHNPTILNVPKSNCSLETNVPPSAPPPPPPPPQPNLSAHTNSIKSNKTFMFKYL